MKRTVLVLMIVYLLALVAGWLWININADTHWLITLYLLSPRWVVALPLAVLIPLNMVVRWQTTWLYALHLGVIVFGLMGYRINSAANTDTTSQHNIGVMTCNLGGGIPQIDSIVSFVQSSAVDIVLLQECPPKISQTLFDELGWNFQQQYNIAIGSRYPLNDCETVARQMKSRYQAIAAIRTDVTLPNGDTSQIVSVHLPTFRPAFEHLQHMNVSAGQASMAELGQVYRDVAQEIQDAVSEQDGSLVIAGDFNVPCESLFYRDYWSRFPNAFDTEGNGFGYTKHTRYHGVRIDHVLGNDAVSFRFAFVGPDFGGDHRPVVARLTIGGTP